MVRDVMNWLDSWAPFCYAQSWDNSGLQLGDPEAPADRVMVALDPGSDVVEEARTLGCGCVVTHHPLLIRPISAVRTDSWPGTVIVRALMAKMSIVAAHTNLDAAREGTNARLRDLLGLEETVSLEAEAIHADSTQYLGMGLSGKLPRALPLRDLARQLSHSLGEIAVKMIGDPEKPVRRASICTGSGASLIGHVLSAGSDVFITGDIKYHDARLAEESGLAMVDIGHFASEKLVLEPLAAYLESKARGEGAQMDVFISRVEKDPFRIVGGKC
ncbi:MAG: Nif3-like dinuclear metal center hexameric protein [Syntrophobacter sp.]